MAPLDAREWFNSSLGTISEKESSVRIDWQ
jgi:hypothetical protein